MVVSVQRTGRIYPPDSRAGARADFVFQTHLSQTKISSLLPVEEKYKTLFQSLCYLI